jgi:hypothetical protein
MIQNPLKFIGRICRKILKAICYQISEAQNMVRMVSNTLSLSANHDTSSGQNKIWTKMFISLIRNKRNRSTEMNFESLSMKSHQVYHGLTDKLFNQDRF